MTRPSAPGDRCFLIRDPANDGINLGKTCLVQKQCACEASDWKVETLEPWVLDEELEFTNGLIFHRPSVRCPAGTVCCVQKDYLRPIDDFSEDSDNVSHPAPPVGCDAH
jgi:hypothetical protein